MENRLLENNFDMEKFIEKRLLEIESLEERKEARDVLTQIFQELCRYTSQKFERLETQITEEIEKQNEKFSIYMGVSSNRTYDSTEGSVFPMIPADMENVEIETKVLLDALHEQKEVNVFTVFFEISQKETASLIKEKRKFHGYIHTAEAEYPVTAELRPSTRYQEVLQNLFKSVVNNGFAWNTICTAYLNKFFDVYLVSAEMVNEERIERIEINFEEYKDKAKYHYFPVWNIEVVDCISEPRKIPCVDHVQYQHIIPKRFVKEGTYLVADTESMITRKNTSDGIEIITDVPDIGKWKMYHIVNRGKQMSEYPVLGNEVNGAVVYPARTKGEITRLIHAVGYQDRMSLTNILFPKEYINKELTYSMDKGITEEFESNFKYQPMVLQFSSKKEDFLQGDILSYIVTIVQRKYPEFRCYGEFVTGQEG